MKPSALFECPHCNSYTYLSTTEVRELADAVGLRIATVATAVGSRRPTPAPQTASPRCPEHHRATPSQYGGLYCPEPVDGGWCRWTDKGQAA